jgi:hypothetical protein
MGNNIAQTIFILLLIGFVAYLVLQLSKLVLGCVILVIATYAFLALAYGVLRLFGLAS